MLSSLQSRSGGILKILAYVLGAIVLLLALAAGTAYSVSNSRLSKKVAVEARPIAIPTSAEMLERGRHLVTTRGCLDCHGKDLAGNKVVDDPMVGQLHGPNITRGRGGLAEGYSDIDYVRALRHGVSRDGRPFLLMPSEEYTKFSDEDLGALIAYLKTVPPVDKERGPLSPGPILRTLISLGEVKLAANVIDHKGSRPAKVTVEATAAYGRYVSASCTGCHGDNLSGGKIPGGPPDWPMAANLTPHPSSRLPQWTEADFVNALKTRKRPDGTEIHPVMPLAFGLMSEVEHKALWLYIKSLAPAEQGKR